MADVYLTNSLTRKKEKFEPINPPNVGMYTCGMTVYDYSHIGHGRKYVGDDILCRVLTYNSYKVKHVQNVTDVGHLVSDADEGEDKIEKGAKKHGKTVWEVAEHFTKHFYDSMDKLNVLRPDVICKATEHIQEQIDLVKKLMEKGYAYETPDAVYFDISKFKDYTRLFGQKLEEKKTAVREGVEENLYKRNPQDFALWVKRVGKHKNHTMHWDSPWGDGFPGWHVECSAMSMKYLGEQFDIHTGGEDHLSIHHPNEIAQSEGATGKKPFVKYWVHHGFLKVNDKKMSKSLGNTYKVSDIEEKGYEPLALRYLFLTAHYKDPLNFTWESLESAQKALNNLRKLVVAAKQGQRTMLSEEKREKTQKYSEQILTYLNDDLNTPKALASLWKAMKSNIPNHDKYDIAKSFDEVFGLKLGEVREVEKSVKVEEVEEEIRDMVEQRDKLRKKGEFEKADEVRKKIANKGYKVRDTEDGTELVKA